MTSFCPNVTVLVWNETSFQCMPECPLPVMSPEGFRANYLITTVCGWMSFVCLVYMLLTYSIFEVNRRWPRRIIFYISLTEILVVVPFVGNSFLDMTSYLCKPNGWEPNDGGWCAAQGY